MEIADIVTKLCSRYNVTPTTIAKKQHGKTPEYTYEEILLKLISTPTLGVEHSFPEIGRTTITTLLRKLFNDKPHNRELWGSWLLGTINLKKCSQCGEIKEFDNYSAYKDSPTGLRNVCRECHSSNNKQYHIDNPTYSSEYGKNYYILNKSKCQERARKYYIDHKESIDDRNSKYRDINKDRLNEISREHYLNNILYYKEYRKKYYESHKAEYTSYDAKRRAIKINATPLWANFAEIKKIYLGRRPGEHVDHIIPLQGELVCGLHCEHNLQYLSIKDNLSKSNSFNIDTYVHSIPYVPPYDR